MMLPNSILHEHDPSCPAEEPELPRRASIFFLYGVGRADSPVIQLLFSKFLLHILLFHTDSVRETPYIEKHLKFFSTKHRVFLVSPPTPFPTSFFTMPS